MTKNFTKFVQHFTSRLQQLQHTFFTQLCNNTLHHSTTLYTTLLQICTTFFFAQNFLQYVSQNYDEITQSTALHITLHRTLQDFFLQTVTFFFKKDVTSFHNISRIFTTLHNNFSKDLTKQTLHLLTQIYTLHNPLHHYNTLQ